MGFLSQLEKKILNNTQESKRIFTEYRMPLYDEVNKCTQKKITKENYSTEFDKFSICIQKKISILMKPKSSDTQFDELRQDRFSRFLRKVSRGKINFKKKHIVEVTRPIVMDERDLRKFTLDSYTEIKELYQHLQKTSKRPVEPISMNDPEPYQIAYFVMMRGAIEFHIGGKDPTSATYH